MLNFGFLNRSFGLPNRDQLIAWYKGRTSDTTLLNYTGNHASPQVRGTSVAGDGSGYGTITGLLTTATFTVGTGSDEPTCGTNNILTIADGDNVWDLKIYHAGVLFADLGMICLDSTTEWDISGNGNHCVWSDFISDPIQEHLDGNGSNRANEDGYSIADGTQYADSYMKTLITSGTRFPAGFGYEEVS